MRAIESGATKASLVAYAWGGMGAAFGPATVLALHWRWSNFRGAPASIVAGTVTVVGIRLFSSAGPRGMFDGAIAAALGFVAAIPVAIIATLLTSPLSTEVTEQFDRVNAKALTAE